MATHLVAGATSGAIAAGFTTPLDVAKTRYGPVYRVGARGRFGAITDPQTSRLACQADPRGVGCAGFKRRASAPWSG